MLQILRGCLCSLQTLRLPPLQAPLFLCLKKTPAPQAPTVAKIDLNVATQEGAHMAFQRADPAPFLPGYLEVQDIPGRKFMSRVVAPARPMARNENLAIVTIDPLPGNVMHFVAVRVVIRDFLRGEMGIPFSEIQPTSLGQAMVRLRDGHARDALIQDSPHVFDNILVSFVKHDRGRNWRAAEFNHECWLLLLDFPRDYLSERHIQQAVAKFAKVLLFQLVDGVEASLLIRARVRDISQVPQFVVFEDPDTVGGESFTIQCELLRHKDPAEVPLPQDPVPEDNILEHLMLFDFFGLGQPVLGQNANAEGDWDPWPEQDHDVNQHLQDNLDNEGVVDEVPAHDIEPAMEALVNPNLAAAAKDAQEVPAIIGNEDIQGVQAQIAVADLNQPPVNLDLNPVIINPFPNDPRGFGEQATHLIQEMGEVFQLNPLIDLEEYEQVQLVDLNLNLNQNQQDEQHNSPRNFLVEEFSSEQLLGTDDINNKMMYDCMASGHNQQDNQHDCSRNFLVEEFSPEQLLGTDDINDEMIYDCMALGKRVQHEGGNNQPDYYPQPSVQMQINGPAGGEGQQVHVMLKEAQDSVTPWHLK